MKTDLNNSFILLKQEVINSILNDTRNGGITDGFYRTECDFGCVINPDNGYENVSKIEFKNDNIIIHTIDDHEFSIHDLVFDDIIYLYDIVNDNDVCETFIKI